MKNFIKITNCDICGSSNLENIINLKKFPLTGIFLKKNKKIRNFDNIFLVCKICGHGQLKNQVNPVYLYQKTYSHRSSQSPLAVQINNDFYKKLLDIKKNLTFDCVLEVGCNDLYLAKRIKKFAKKIIGVDPIWKDKILKIDKKTTVIGGFINENNLISNIKEQLGKSKINLVISSHTFEHVDKIKDSLSKIVDIVDDECLFVIETPSLDSIVRNGHYDQIFHQHFHYLSESSIKTLIQKLDCEFLGLDYNYRVWGGNVIFWFRKKSTPKKNIKNYFNFKKIKKDFKDYQIYCQNKVKYLKVQKENIVGFGAAQMLPIIAYHSKDDLSFLSYLFDDNKFRQNKYLPLIKLKISKTNEKIIKNSFVLITANEMCRPIIKRLEVLNPKRIYTWYSDF